MIEIIRAIGLMVWLIAIILFVMVMFIYDIRNYLRDILKARRLKVKD